jgi:hypothetical protein
MEREHRCRDPPFLGASRVTPSHSRFFSSKLAQVDAANRKRGSSRDGASAKLAAMTSAAEIDLLRIDQAQAGGP